MIQREESISSSSTGFGDAGTGVAKKGDNHGNDIEFQHVDRDQGISTIVEKGVRKGNVDNPLEGLSRSELNTLVDQFLTENNLQQHSEIVHKGAILAQRPFEYEDIPELTEKDRDDLRFEDQHKWVQPWSMYLTVAVCSIGACVQGWDQTGISGANLYYPKIFGISTADPTSPDYDKNNWITGLVASAPYMGAFGFSAWATDPVNHYLGRRGCLFLSGIFCLLCPIGSAFTQNWWQLFIVRVLLGFGIGFKEVTAPILAAENAPTRIRGALTMTWQMWTAFGIFLGYAANLAVHKTGANVGWRLMLGSAFIPAVPLLLLVYTVPESPRWYIKRGRANKAFESLLRLRRTELLAARDLYSMYIGIKAEEHAIRNTTYFQRLIQLFYKNRIRQATLASWVVMIGQQMCGINIMAFFSSSIFQEVITAMGASPESAITRSMWASFGFGLINWLFSFPAFFTIDTFGRRTLLLFTFPQMFWTLLAAGLCYLIHDDKVRLGLVALFIYLFTIAYSPGEGPVPFAYSAEVFPVSHRELGMAWAVVTNNFWSCVLSLTYFRLSAAFTPTGAFGFYAGLNLLAFVWIFLWVPETKQLSLEQLDAVFSIPTTQFMKFQFEKELPYFWNHYIKRDKAFPRPNILLLEHEHYDPFAA